MNLSIQNKGKKIVNDYSNFPPNPSLSAAPIENYQYGMPPNFFAGQTPPPGSIRPSRGEPVRSVAPTGQTDAMVLGSASQPQLVPLPTLAAPSWRSLCRRILQSHTVNPPFPPPLPKDV